MVDVICDAGLDGIWVGDHLALSRADASRYPGRASGEFFLDPEAPWYEAFIALSFIAARVEGLDLGLGVAVPALRPPLVVAKQVATLARLTPRNDLTLGVGAGWLRSEFDAVGVPYARRGRRLEDSVTVIREYWTGEPTPGSYGEYTVPADLTTYPTPGSALPILIGGVSPAAYARAARVGDGWIGMYQDWEGGDRAVTEQVAAFRAAWGPARGEPTIALVGPIAGPVVKRADFPELLRKRLETFAALGVQKLVVSVSWRELARTRDLLCRIGDVNAQLGVDYDPSAVA
jgi:alkanesulfonate monooxygenase SsuD/methylene tetrahydromethanopterin reductase-like flavin-dependent oxidoreductase (luciferase family)